VAEIREATRLEWFIRTRGLKPKRVAEEAGISRQHLLRLRKGQAMPSADVMKRIREACSKLLRKRVALRDLFDLG